MTEFKNVGDAMAKRDALIMKLVANRETKQTLRNMQDNPGKAGSVAAADASHEKTCDEFVEAHGFVVANRAKL